MKAADTKGLGYLPQDRPPPGALASLGFQHVLTMFPATALVAILTGFDVGVTVFASGLATIVAVAGSGFRIPLYYGGSFSYLASVIAVVGAEWGGTRVAQVGVVATGIVNVLVGLVVRKLGKGVVDKVLPPRSPARSRSSSASRSPGPPSILPRTTGGWLWSPSF